MEVQAFCVCWPVQSVGVWLLSGFLPPGSLFWQGLSKLGLGEVEKEVVALVGNQVR